jgi:hypothetical protein
MKTLLLPVSKVYSLSPHTSPRGPESTSSFPIYSTPLTRPTSASTTMTDPDPPNDDSSMPSVSADEKPQHDDDGNTILIGLGEDERDHVCCRHIIHSAPSVKTSWLTIHSTIPAFFLPLETFTPHMPIALSQRRRPGSTAEMLRLPCPRA